MSQSEKRSAAGAVGAKTARACDSCLRRRARWYCAADDAFLCQGCDSAVHSANSLARRNERLRLKTSSSSSFKTNVVPGDDDFEEPMWHHGFKCKARTPRGGAKSSMQADASCVGKIDPLVLETASLEDCAAVEEEQLLYRVPIFDPVLCEFCSPSGSFDDVKPPAVVGHQPNTCRNAGRRASGVSALQHGPGGV